MFTSTSDLATSTTARAGEHSLLHFDMVCVEKSPLLTETSKLRANSVDRGHPQDFTFVPSKRGSRIEQLSSQEVFSVSSPTAAMTQTAFENVVLRSFKCLSCIERENNAFLDDMPELTDTIPVPPAYSKAFAWPDECAVSESLRELLRTSKTTLVKGEAVAVPTVRVRVVDGELECYAYAPALILCQKARGRLPFPKNFAVFKYGKRTYFKVDDALLDILKAKDGKHTKSARARCEQQLRTLKDDEIAKFLTREWEGTFGSDRGSDLSAVHDEIARLYSVLHQAGREEVLKSHRRITEQYGISVQAPVDAPKFETKPAEFCAVSWWCSRQRRCTNAGSTRLQT